MQVEERERKTQQWSNRSYGEWSDTCIKICPFKCKAQCRARYELLQKRSQRVDGIAKPVAGPSKPRPSARPFTRFIDARPDALQFITVDHPSSPSQVSLGTPSQAGNTQHNFLTVEPTCQTESLRGSSSIRIIPAREQGESLGSWPSQRKGKSKEKEAHTVQGATSTERGESAQNEGADPNVGGSRRTDKRSTPRKRRREVHDEGDLAGDAVSATTLRASGKLAGANCL